MRIANSCIFQNTPRSLSLSKCGGFRGLNRKFVFLHAFVVLLISACGQKPQHADDGKILGDTAELAYAEGFAIIENADFKTLVVYDPWQSEAMLAKYYLVRNDSTDVPLDGMKVKIPVESLAVTAVTQIEFLNLLHEIDKISGVCSPELIYNQELQHKYQVGKIENLGDAFNINLEKSLKLNPDIVMMSGFKQDDPYAKRVLQAGVSVVYNNEWMESSLLARAEWIKFVAAFFDKTEEADSIFNGVAQAYESVKEKAQAIQDKPKILTGSNFRGTWYMPGGKSFMAQLYHDAGADYRYADDGSKGSLPLSVESVLVDFSDADIWLNCNFTTINELIQVDKKHALFQPVQTGNVYNFNKRMLKSGANDYWESAVARPDLLLADVIAVLHPNLLPDHELVYTARLK
jgi:iron complex transport system substrate-binding protein